MKAVFTALGVVVLPLLNQHVPIGTGLMTKAWHMLVAVQFVAQLAKVMDGRRYKVGPRMVVPLILVYPDWLLGGGKIP